MILNKTILVTGGAGFIGSHLCERLSNYGNKVYSLDNYSTGSSKNHVSGVNYIEGNTSNISKHVHTKPDIIYHLGEYSRVEQSFEEPGNALNSNLGGISNVLEFARANKSKLIYAGSSTKYGDNGETKGSSPYAWSKYVNTELVKKYGEWYNLNYAITYFYNVYGPREISAGKYATLIALFNNKLRKDEPLTIVKPGLQKRNFTHIDDIIDGLILIGAKGKGDEFGIGHHKEYSVLEIANLFKQKIEYLPERRGNRKAAQLITKKTKELGWFPKREIEDYIKDLVKNKGV